MKRKKQQTQQYKTARLAALAISDKSRKRAHRNTSIASDARRGLRKLGL